MRDRIAGALHAPDIPFAEHTERTTHPCPFGVSLAATHVLDR
jgi:hypothetical protein